MNEAMLQTILLAAIILVVIPIGVDTFRLNLVGKYLTYAFVAIGLVLCWGLGGILSLGQGIFSLASLRHGPFSRLPPARLEDLLGRFERVRAARGEFVWRQAGCSVFLCLLTLDRHRFRLSRFRLCRRPDAPPA